MDDGAAQISFDESQYEPIAKVTALTTPGALVRVGRTGSCRYCGETDLKHFRKTAHLLPESSGNRRVVSLDECDRCNKKFSDFDSQLACFLNPIRTIGQIRGKKGVPRWDQPGSRLRRSLASEGRRGHLSIEASDLRLEEAVAWDPVRQVMELRTLIPNNRFRPRQAYKALAKAGLGLLPEQEITNFSKMIQWVRQRKDNIDFPVLEVGFQHATLANPLPVMGLFLLRRRQPECDLPYMVALFVVGSFLFHISLMSDNKDDYDAPRPMGLVNMNWSTSLAHASGPEIKQQFGDTIFLNWSSQELCDHSLEWLMCRVNTRSSTMHMTLYPRADAGFRADGSVLNPIHSHT